MRKSDGPNLASGVYAALLTPRANDSLEAAAAPLLDYLDRVGKAGVDGLVFFGSTGEFVHFDVEERMRAVALAIRRSRIPVLVNVSHSTLDGARLLAEHAIDSGAAGVLAMPLYFYRYGVEEIAAFYDQLIVALDARLPLYLYNLPFFTNPIPDALINRLLETGSVAGIKDSSGERERMTALCELHRRARFQLLVGHEQVYIEALRAGADGIVSGVAAAVPELPVAIDRAVRLGDEQTTNALGARLNEFLEWINAFPTTVAIKQAAQLRGWLPCEFAAPLGKTAEANLANLRAWFPPWLDETLSLCATLATVRT